MTEESSEVPGELIGKSRAVVDFPFAAAPPSPPPPFPPLPSPHVLPSPGAPGVRVESDRVAGGRREVCSHPTAGKAESGEGRRGEEWGAPRAHSAGRLGAPRRLLPPQPSGVGGV